MLLRLEVKCSLFLVAWSLPVVLLLQSAPLLPLAWCTLGHSLRLRGRFWESNCCYKVASHLRACPTAAFTEPETATGTAASAPRATLAAAAAAAAAVPPKLTRALENTLVRARMDPKELRKALPTLMCAWPFPLLGLLWLLPFGFAVTAAGFGAVALGASLLAASYRFRCLCCRCLCSLLFSSSCMRSDVLTCEVLAAAGVIQTCCYAPPPRGTQIVIL